MLLVTCNAQPYSKARLALAGGRRPPVRPRRGGAGRATALKLLDDAGIDGEIAVREVRTGRAEIVQMWGRTESVRQEFRRLRAQ